MSNSKYSSLFAWIKGLVRFSLGFCVLTQREVTNMSSTLLFLFSTWILRQFIDLLLDLLESSSTFCCFLDRIYKLTSIKNDADGFFENEFKTIHNPKKIICFFKILFRICVLAFIRFQCPVNSSSGLICLFFFCYFAFDGIDLILNSCL